MTDTLILGETLALLSASTGAISSIIISDLGQKADSSLLGFVRMLIVVPFMVALALLSDGTAIFHAPIADILWIALSGIIGFFITDIFLFRAYALFGAQKTMVVMCFTPVLSTVLSIAIFSEVPTLMQFAGIAMTIIGIIVIVLQGGEKTSAGKVISYGLICAVLAAVFQSGADLSAKAAISDLPYISCASLRGVSGLMAWLVYGLFKRDTLFKDMDTLKKPKNLGLLTLSVIVSTWLGTTMAMGSLKYAPAGIATSLKQISPVLILPYDFFVLKKKSWQSVIGTVIAVAGVILIFS